MERQCTQGLLFLEEDVQGFSLLTVYVWFTSAASRAGIEGGTMHACTTPPTMNTLHKYLHLGIVSKTKQYCMFQTFLIIWAIRTGKMCMNRTEIITAETCYSLQM